MKRIIMPLLAVLLILTVNPASAFWNPFASQQSIVQQPDNFTSLYDGLQILNTQQHIDFVSGYMESHGVKVIKVHVIDYDADFYVISGSGVTLNVPSHIDTTVKLTESHIRQIEGYVANNEISGWDQVQLLWIYKVDGN